jgi:hypothetical protein
MTSETSNGLVFSLRLVVSSPTPAIHLGYGETMASIGQGVVGEAHCISLVEVAAEQNG